MRTVSMQLPESVFAALRKDPDEFVQEIRIVAAVNSPLIVLFKSQQADLLAELFSEIVVPGAVWEEIIAAGKTDAPILHDNKRNTLCQLPSFIWMVER